MARIISNDYLGLGDNIYKIPFVYQLQKEHEVFLYTPFPELFKGMNVKFCRPHTRLKTQCQNIAKHDMLGTWTLDKPEGLRCTMSYTGGLNGAGIITALEDFVEINDWFFSIPHIEDGYEKAVEIRNSVPKDKKLCLLRLPTTRDEWECQTRNPDPKYFQEIINAYSDRFYFMSIGDVGPEEPLIGTYTGIDYECHNKQIGLWETINLAKLADLVISPPCFILPLAIAYDFKAYFLYGGYVKHQHLIDSRMDLSKIGYAQPEPFCNCVKNYHDCNKEITNLLWRFDEYCHRVGLV